MNLAIYFQLEPEMILLHPLGDLHFRPRPRRLDILQTQGITFRLT